MQWKFWAHCGCQSRTTCNIMYKTIGSKNDVAKDNNKRLAKYRNYYYQ